MTDFISIQTVALQVDGYVGTGFKVIFLLKRKSRVFEAIGKRYAGNG